MEIPEFIFNIAEAIREEYLKNGIIINGQFDIGESQATEICFQYSRKHPDEIGAFSFNTGHSDYPIWSKYNCDVGDFEVVDRKTMQHFKIDLKVNNSLNNPDLLGSINRSSLDSDFTKDENNLYLVFSRDLSKVGIYLAKPLKETIDKHLKLNDINIYKIGRDGKEFFGGWNQKYLYNLDSSCKEFMHIIEYLK